MTFDGLSFVLGVITGILIVLVIIVVVCKLTE